MAICFLLLLSSLLGTVAAAVKALREAYEHLFKGGAPADLKSRSASNDEMNQSTIMSTIAGGQ